MGILKLKSPANNMTIKKPGKTENNKHRDLIYVSNKR